MAVARLVADRVGQDEHVIDAEEEKNSGQHGESERPGERDVAGTNFHQRLGGGFQFRIQLDDGERGLVPIRVVENKARAFGDGEEFVVIGPEAKTDFGAERHDDFVSGRFGEVK